MATQIFVDPNTHSIAQVLPEQSKSVHSMQSVPKDATDLQSSMLASLQTVRNLQWRNSLRNDSQELSEFVLVCLSLTKTPKKTEKWKVQKHR